MHEDPRVNIDLIIRSGAGEVAIALMKDKVLAELHRERDRARLRRGRRLPRQGAQGGPRPQRRLRGCGPREGRLPALLRPRSPVPQRLQVRQGRRHRHVPTAACWTIGRSDTDIPKDGKLADVLSASQSILVQIAKEPISTKGPRLTAEVTLAGRYMVLVPFINKINICSRLTDEMERKRLKELMHGHQAEELRGHHPHQRRRQEAPRTSRPTSRP